VRKDSRTFNNIVKYFGNEILDETGGKKNITKLKKTNRGI
jgi:hypothetical protein